MHLRFYAQALTNHGALNLSMASDVNRLHIKAAAQSRPLMAIPVG